MAIYDNLKPENLILNNVYLSYSFWESGQVNVVKVEQDSNNINQLDPFSFKIIANDGYKIDYNNCLLEIDSRDLVYEDLQNLTEPTEDDLLKIDFTEFETAEKIGNYKTDLDVDTRDCNYKNVDILNFKTLEKTVNGNKFYINLIDPKETSCMIDIFTDETSFSSDYSVDDNKLTRYSVVQSFEDGIGSTYEDKYLRIYKINFNVQGSGPGGEEPEQPLSRNIFTTYIVNPSILSEIVGQQEIYNDIIINTFSYPIKFKDEDLTETIIKLAGTETSTTGKTFIKNNIKTEIFKFTIPKFNNVEQCILNLPFNQSISLNYEDLENKTITGTLIYEVLTGSTTLIINNGEYNIYKGKFSLESDLPYKPTGEFSSYKKTETRLSNDIPLLIIKCSQIIKQDEVIKGRIESEIKGILKSELELLNALTEQGVLING